MQRLSLFLVLVPFVCSSWLTQKLRHSKSTAEPPNARHFLHLTDVHVDSDYRANATVSSSCHKLPGKKSKGGEPISGKWGAPGTRCDTPWTLLNATLQWLQDEWSHKLDFIIYTGDNARHDSDRKQPRTKERVYQTNKDIYNLLRTTFPDIPIIPNIGNNDIYPHNTMFPGPNSALLTYAEMWHKMIPEEQIHSFQNNGHFSRDLQISTGTLRVISLNTMWFFARNSAVDGCSPRKDPGTKQLKWLELNLQEVQTRKNTGENIGVMLIGHVPPGRDEWYPVCRSQYIKLVLSYNDIIHGQHFGHANVDLFLLLRNENPEPLVGNEVNIHGMSNRKYLRDLLTDYKKVTTQKLTSAEVSVAYVTPSIFPTMLPGLRFYHYNPEDKALGFTPLGYTQYFSNITHWNSVDKHLEWSVAYQSWQAYGLKDLGSQQFINLAQLISEKKRIKKHFVKWYYVGSRD